MWGGTRWAFFRGSRKQRVESWDVGASSDLQPQPQQRQSHLLVVGTSRAGATTGGPLPEGLPSGLSAEQFLRMFPKGTIVTNSGEIISSPSGVPSAAPAAGSVSPDLGAHCDVIGVCNAYCNEYYPCNDILGFGCAYEACYNQYGQFTGYTCAQCGCGCRQVI